MGNILSKCPKCGTNNLIKDNESFIICYECGYDFEKQHSFLVTTPEPKEKLTDKEYYEKELTNKDKEYYESLVG